MNTGKHFEKSKIAVVDILQHLALSIILIGLAACATANDTAVQECSTRFIDQKHADPAAAGRTCSCLVQRLPSDKVDEAEEVLLDLGEKGKQPDVDYDYWFRNQGEAWHTIGDCRVLGCAGKASIDDRSDFDVALSAQNEGDFRTAIEHYSRFIEAYPTSIGAISNRGRTYFEIGEYDLAIADLTEAANKAPNFNDSYKYLADSYHHEGRDVEALAITDKAIATMSHNLIPSIYAVRGQIHESLGDREAAIADYRAVPNYFLEEWKLAREALKRLGAE